METPICDFVREYAQKSPLRLHMPGHKGIGPLGCEAWDITEVKGADVLDQAGGIIKQSEENAAALFGTAATLYSTEGSSQCIRAMVYLAMLHAKAQGRRPVVLAGRNAHKTFLTAAALLDVDLLWLRPQEGVPFAPWEGGLLSCLITPAGLEAALSTQEGVTAVYLTSPDYLGNRLDIGHLAQVCHRHNALLLVDNAHGAYLRFLERSLHPMDLGADLCCDSAHKTLPVLTGGAYLHISRTAPQDLKAQVRSALSLFGSTSPSYLILQSLDAANRYLAEGYRERLRDFSAQVWELKKRINAQGWTFLGGEPLKLTLFPKPYGYTGLELAALMREKGMEPEMADPDFVVMMLTPELGKEALDRVEEFLSALPPKEPILKVPPPVPTPATVLTPRQALFSPQEELPLEKCLGRVLAAPTVSCPPAVPILVCGEEIDQTAIDCFRYYGHETCTVVR